MYGFFLISDLLDNSIRFGNSVNLCPFSTCTNESIGYITNITNKEDTMLFHLALILVAIGTVSTLWAITEILFLELFLSDRAKLNRSKSVRNEFDK